MAPSSLTLQYDALLSTTLFKWSRTLQDAISTANALLYVLMKTEGGYQTVSDVGERMQMPLMYELAPADSYAGYDVLDVSPIEGITSSFWNWRQAATPISISGDEELKNAGEERMINLLESKTKQAEIGLRTFFDKAFLQGNGINSATAITTAYTSPSNGSVFIDPLPKLVAYDPTASLTVGNIPQVTYTWWRNQAKSSTSTTYAGLLKELRNARNNAGKGPGGFPNLHIADQSVYEVYEASLAAAHRNPSYQKADIPFDNIGFHGDPLTWDEFVPNAEGGTTTQSATAGTWYMLNTQFFGVKVHESRNFTSTPFIKPENQDAKTAHIYWYGAVGVSNRRKQGVVYGIDTTIAS